MNEERNQRLLIQNAGHVYTANPDRDVYNNIDILIEGGKISQIGSNISREVTDVDRRIDATDMVVIPGMVNTHHHLFQTLYRGIDIIKKRPIVEWVQNMSSLLDGLDDEAAYSAACVGMAELILSGCTTTSDHLYVYPHGRTSIFDATIEASRDLGMRFHPVRGNLSRNQKGDSSWKPFVLEDDDLVLSNIQEVIQKYHDSSRFSMCQVGVGPCAYYSGSDELFRQVAELARKWQVRLHTHAFEDPNEDEECRRIFSRSALEFLESVGFLGSDVWLAHGVGAQEKEIQTFADTHTSVAHTPWCSTSKKRITRVEQMLRAGVNVSLGTDGSASNDSSNMLLEARLAGRMQGMNPDNDGVSYYRATQILELATIGGARSLGRQDEIGSIEHGKAADLAIIDITKRLECTGFGNPLESVFHSGLTTVDYTIINGRVVVDRGNLVTMNGLGLTEIIRNHNHIAEAIRKRAEGTLGKPLSVGWVRAFLK
ncbi:amidohydrolase family protein [Candidatus Woesebacteria bacterium]|nr:amidohydrolase family protein [Candidatus Woesebacteria bacterium]